MADAVVSIVLEKFTDSLIQELKFLGGVGDQVRLAQTELQFIQGYLKDADSRQQDNVVRIWVANITDAAYDLEDVTETFVLKVLLKRKGSVLRRYCRIFIEGVYLHQIGTEIESITNNISKLKLSLPSYLQVTRESGGDTSFHKQQERRLAYPHVIEPHVVGLKARTDFLVEHLVKESRHRVVSIWGMGGLGKTTLAKQVYNHDEVKRHFDCFAWVCISQQCQGREVLEEILTKLISPTNEQRIEIAKLKKDEIAKRLCTTQRERKCLVVIDDIWTRDAWNLLEAGFPMNEETESRIVLTTRNKEVASSAGKNGFLYNTQALTGDESWELLEKIALTETEDTNPEIYEKKKELGKKMLQHCGGLPLGITVLAGLLVRKETVDEWDTVHRNFYEYIRRGTDLGAEYKGEEYEGVSWILALSYDHLPYRLKLCFLYLAHFPEDYEIPVNSLTKLWMAEGFTNSESAEIMEDVAYMCLSELVGRCMVQVGTYGSSNKIKTCRLHDLMRDLCILKAKEGNFLHFIDYSAATGTKETPRGRVRRLAICLVDKDDAYALGRDQIHGHVRSLLYFVSGYLYLRKGGEKLLLSLSTNLKLLRVLKLEGVRMEDFKLPRQIGNLVHLRFLSLKNSDVVELPSSITNLVWLQTLDVRILGPKFMKIQDPSMFLKMDKLRHIYLPMLYEGHKKLSFAIDASNLQTIVNVEADTGDLLDFGKLTNLRKLGVRTYDGKELETGMSSITFEKLQSLSVYCIFEEEQWNIVLSCPNIYKLRLAGRITELPQDLLRLPNLMKLTLNDMYQIKNDHIKVLEKLPSLRMLTIEKLYGNQVAPAELVFSAKGFPRLAFLSLVKFGEIIELIVLKGAMPNLCRLHIESSYRMEKIPEGLRYITTLKELSVKWMSPTFCSRIRVGGEDFYKIQHVPSVIIGDAA